MYHVTGIEAECVLDLFRNPVWFCIREVNFVEDRDYRKILVIRKEKIGNLRVRNRDIQEITV